MALSLVSVEDGYIVVEDESGDETPTTPGPVFETLTLWSDYDLSSAWLDAVRAHRNSPQSNGWWSKPDRAEFVESVLRQIADADDVNIEWCENCEEPTDGATAVLVSGGDAYACQSCYDSDYRSCDDCGDVTHYENFSYTLSGESVCDSCRDNSYSYCEECDGYYHDSDSGEHSHGGCDCGPPSLSVTMRNGDSVLTEDERVSVSLPAGVISDEGMSQIANLVRNHYYSLSADTDEAAEERGKWWTLSYDVPTMDAQWQTKEGNFTKRLSKLAHKSYALKFPADLLTKVGNIARDNSNGSDIAVELTRDLNLPAEDFYHEDSCWWQSYSESRCALKTNGGIGMRTFGGYGGNEVTGRAWIMPLRVTGEDGALRPTFDARTADAYMVFNGYGDLSGYTPARVVAGMAGMTYRKVGFDCSPMYVNNGSGYLVASEEVIEKHKTTVSLYVDIHSNLYHTDAALVAA